MMHLHLGHYSGRLAIRSVQHYYPSHLTTHYCDRVENTSPNPGQNRFLREEHSQRGNLPRSSREENTDTHALNSKMAYSAPWQHEASVASRYLFDIKILPIRLSICYLLNVCQIAFAAFEFAPFRSAWPKINLLTADSYQP